MPVLMNENSQNQQVSLRKIEITSQPATFQKLWTFSKAIFVSKRRTAVCADKIRIKNFFFRFNPHRFSRVVLKKVKKLSKMSKMGWFEDYLFSSEFREKALEKGRFLQFVLLTETFIVHSCIQYLRKSNKKLKTNRPKIYLQKLSNAVGRKVKGKAVSLFFHSCLFFENQCSSF